ncbi:hypothetical protein [Undibacterium sp.]|uniref:hypothetical protein n=1 Tax=Undibacterium sp. TaxID=1914977 RepID=UPI0027307040|nr:hypothetical protein [Undibacterium sp.]MDP1978676.1 hypothetical protein [Undibacterium sp.]
MESDSSYRPVSTPVGLEDSWLISYKRTLKHLVVSIECWNTRVADLMFENPTCISDNGSFYVMDVCERVKNIDVAILFPYQFGENIGHKKVFSVLDVDDPCMDILSDDCVVTIREPFANELISQDARKILDQHYDDVYPQPYTIPISSCKFQSYEYYTRNLTLILSVTVNDEIFQLEFFDPQWFSEYNIMTMAMFSKQALESILLQSILQKSSLLSSKEFKHFQFLNNLGQPCADIICKTMKIRKK